MENEMNVNVPLEVIKASEIEPKEVKWLWYPYIPYGKVTLLQGDPGDGKSKLMLSIAALLSKGEPLWWRKKSYGASVAKMKNCEERLRKLFIKSAIQRNGNRIFR